MLKKTRTATLGSLFAGIGGFDLGFERAGFTTRWQVEIDPICRAVLADRFPHARRIADIRTAGRRNLVPVDVIAAGFPCQDVSAMGKRKGLAGARTGLFWELCRVVDELRPKWLVLENVVGLLFSNGGQDFETVLRAIADRGYVGFWRVLNAQYFGVAQARRRVFLVGGLGEPPPAELLLDAAPARPVRRTFGPLGKVRSADGWPAYTLLAKSAPSLIPLGVDNLVCHEARRGAMAERARMSEAAGLCLGLGEADYFETRAAGNAVVPQVAEWIARRLLPACGGLAARGEGRGQVSRRARA